MSLTQNFPFFFSFSFTLYISPPFFCLILTLSLAHIFSLSRTFSIYPFLIVLYGARNIHSFIYVCFNFWTAIVLVPVGWANVYELNLFRVRFSYNTVRFISVLQSEDSMLLQISTCRNTQKRQNHHSTKQHPSFFSRSLFVSLPPSSSSISIFFALTV